MLRFGSSMGFYRTLESGFLDRSFELEGEWFKYKLVYEVIMLYYTCVIHVILMPYSLMIILTNPLIYLMFGMIVSILSTYHSNTYCLHIVHVRSLGYWLAFSGRDFKAFTERRLVSPRSIRGYHYYVIFYVLSCRDCFRGL